MLLAYSTNILLVMLMLIGMPDYGTSKTTLGMIRSSVMYRYGLYI